MKPELTRNIQKKINVVKYPIANIVFPQVSPFLVATASSHSAWL